MKQRASQSLTSAADADPLGLRARIEGAIGAALADLDDPSVPPRLRAATQHAVFPGGGRVRPSLCLGVAVACGDANPTLADAAAVAVELLHCASLVHDDLPTFDDAPTRRGRASVHAAFGEQLAVLAGDGLIVLAFERLARAGADGSVLARVTAAISRGAGVRGGIVAGQAWESEPEIDIEAYHRAKTGALIEAAVEAGALAGGGDAARWRQLGANFGAAYQLADDIADWLGDAEALGKPTGQDLAHQRPNALHRLGTEQAQEALERTVRAALASIPPCQHAPQLEHWVGRALGRLLPHSIAEGLPRSADALAPGGGERRGDATG